MRSPSSGRPPSSSDASERTATTRRREKALLRLGGRTGRRTRRHGQRRTPACSSLTERQREVAELVRRGHTNRDIATAMFLSEKTVERHLARIFAKLGVSRRTELALLVAAEGAGDTPRGPNGRTRLQADSSRLMSALGVARHTLQTPGYGIPRSGRAVGRLAPGRLRPRFVDAVRGGSAWQTSVCWLAGTVSCRCSWTCSTPWTRPRTHSYCRSPASRASARAGCSTSWPRGPGSRPPRAVRARGRVRGRAAVRGVRRRARRLAASLTTATVSRRSPAGWRPSWRSCSRPSRRSVPRRRPSCSKRSATAPTARCGPAVVARAGRAGRPRARRRAVGRSRLGRAHRATCSRTRCAGPGARSRSAFRPAQVPPQLDVALAAALRHERATTPGARAAERGRRRRPARTAGVARRCAAASIARAAATRSTCCSSRAAPRWRHARRRRRARLGVPAAVRAALASELSSLSAPRSCLAAGRGGRRRSVRGVAGRQRRRHRRGRRAGSHRRAAASRSSSARPRSPGGSPFATRSSARPSTSSPRAAGEPARTRVSRRLLAAANARRAAQAPHVERSAEHGDAERDRRARRGCGGRAQAAPPRSRRAGTRPRCGCCPRPPTPKRQRIELLVAMANALFGSGPARAEPQRAVRGPRADARRAPRPRGDRRRLRRGRAAARPPPRRARPADARISLPARHGSPATVRLEIELAAGAPLREPLRGDARWAEQARRGAARLGQRALEVAATGQLAIAQYFLGLPASDTVDQAAAGLDALDDAELAGRLDIGCGWGRRRRCSSATSARSSTASG